MASKRLQDGAKTSRRINKSDYASSVFRSGNTKIAQDRRRATPEWPIWPQDGPRWPQDDPKMVPRWHQGDHKMVLSCKRGANFAKLAMPSSVRSPRGPQVAPRQPKTSRDGPKMASRRPQNGALVWARCEFCYMSSPVVGPLSERAQSDAKTTQDEPRWSRDDPRWPEEASRRSQDDAKMDSRGHKLRRRS